MANQILISSIKKNSYDISAWFEKHQKRIPIPFLTSIVIRDGGFKIGSLENHLFPVGINNLCKKDLQLGPQLIKKFFKRYHADVGTIKRVIVLVTVENPNPFYYEHLLTLQSLLKKASIKPVLATLENISRPVTLKTPSKKSLNVLKAFIKGKKLQTSEGVADFVYVSHPFSLDIKRQLSDLTQTINPPIKVLARKEKRSEYLFLFNQLAQDFAAATLKVDPWLLKNEFQVEKHVNFDERSGVEKITSSAETLLSILNMKYKEYDIPQRPTVRIINNMGTYGMGIISINSPSDLIGLYKKKKAKRTGGKSQSIINDVLIQEEIPEHLLFKKFQGELVIYLIGNEVLGGYIRTYASESKRNVLAARQDLFLPICLSQGAHAHSKRRLDKKLSLLYSNVSRLGGVAVGYEIDRIPL